MHTQGSESSSQHAAAEAVITTDIDFTADLAQPPTTSSIPLRRMRAEPPVEPRVAPGDEPRHPRAAAPARERATPPGEPRLPIAPGRVLCDRYVLAQIIGIGGMCTVFRARDLEATPGSGKPAFVALKTPRPDYADPARAIERLQREFEHASKLSHGGIVQPYELASDGEHWFMTMELLEGESLASIMRRQPGALPGYLSRRVLRGIGDALAYAHAAGIAHGDLNPANVFVLPGERVKLIDFGAACRDGERPTAAATLAYASPQVLEGETPQLRDDLFSFACIAYEIVTGRHPFQQRPANAARAEGLQPETPTTLANEQALALMAALSFEREARPDDVKALAKTLAPDPARARTISFDADLEPPAPEKHGERRWWLFAAACLIAMIGAVVFTRTFG